MSIDGLAIIGESINDSVPSTRQMYEENNIDGIVQMAKTQDEKGAAYIDVNVGSRSPAFMADVVRRIQKVTAKPLSIDTPDPAIAAAGLDAYDPGRTGGKRPVLNSISPLRLEMFDFYHKRPFMPILMLTERVENGVSLPNQTAEQTYETAKAMLAVCRERMPDFTNSNCIIDAGIAPIGSDTDGNLKRLLAALELMHGDAAFLGVHRSVGLSNFTVMLPARRGDGSPVKGPLESAFLTLSVPLGMDMVVGSVARRYDLLADDHPALVCVKDFLKLEGYDGLARLMEFYS